MRGKAGWGFRRSMAGCPGSLTSCPGPKTAAVAAMCDSGYRETFHNLHLLLGFFRENGSHSAIFLIFPPIDGEIE